MHHAINPTAKTFALASAVAVFVGLPVLFYLLGDAPRRSYLKEGLSLLTLLSFSLMLGQFFLARSNATVLALFKPPAVQKIHKWIAYGAIAIIALHPFFIVLPRYFEAGVRPWDAFWTMLTSLDSLGVLLGLIAWATMIVLGVSAFFRMALMKRFKTRYRGWRTFHAVLAVGFTVAAIWHAIDLGRHTDAAMSAFFIAIAAAGFTMLARLYWRERPGLAASAPTAAALPEGAK